MILKNFRSELKRFNDFILSYDTLKKKDKNVLIRFSCTIFPPPFVTFTLKNMTNTSFVIGLNCK